MRVPIVPIIVIVMLLGAADARAQQPPEKLETQKLTDRLYFITGPGGNIALMVGTTGVFLVDDQIAPMTPQLKKAIAAITPKPVRFVFNTHWHRDHTGGNAVLGGEGAVIVAHESVRKRLSTEQFVALMNKKVPPSPEPALPVITFAESIMFHVDGDDIEATHVDPAHTDGDSIVYFKKANVLHMGDTFMSMGYPFIDTSSGGTVDGFVKAADHALAIAQPSTKIIPGHGPVADRERLRAFRDMVVTIRDRIKKLAAAGKTLTEVQAARPTAEYDAAWGTAFIRGPQLVETIYNEVANKP
ncbi:MAG TPA: MBL fold metallo-hydrolase [Polyangia bacterium]|nr:MBL fold metallo-hydrolase [Polyangia bacterium]